MMGFAETTYDKFLAPFEKLRLSEKRGLLLSQTFGKVLEIGVGTGVNLAHYPYSQLEQLDLIDIDLTQKVIHYKFPNNFPVSIAEYSVENLPFDDAYYDFVVFTLVFCSVPDPIKGLSEVMRVLKPGGKILFIEHVLPHRHGLKQLFKGFSPLWKKMAHGCHLDRETLQLIKLAGFEIEFSEHFFKSSFISGVAKKST
jgi:SAM-dependent methyltransferase